MLAKSLGTSEDLWSEENVLGCLQLWCQFVQLHGFSGTASWQTLVFSTTTNIHACKVLGCVGSNRCCWGWW
jgi:hypothetical protein